jgi:cell division control protein 11
VFSIQDVKEYVEAQYRKLLKAEAATTRNIDPEDTRVHVLIYFITPCLSTDLKRPVLTELDTEFMKALAPRVNIVPVVGKADSLTREELAVFKEKVSIRSWSCVAV